MRRIGLLLAFALAGCGEEAREPAKPAAPRAQPTATATATAAPRRAPAPRVPAAVRAQAAGLSREQQVAQLFLVGFEGTDATVFPALRERGWGGLLLTADNVLSPDQGAVLGGEATVGWEIAPLVAAVDVPGFEAPPQSPSDRAADVRAAAEARAQAMRAAGFNLALAPRADVAIEAAEGTFGDDAERVTALVVAAARGFRAGGVIPAAGRFPGEGAANQDPLEGPAIVGLSVEELQARDLLPYRGLLRHAPALVVSSAAFAAYDPVTPAALTPEIVQGLLRDDLGYTGVAISDDLAGVAAATGGSIGDAAVEALRAGIDMVQVSEPAEAEAAYRAVLAARIPAGRLEEALLRVLALKRSAD